MTVIPLARCPFRSAVRQTASFHLNAEDLPILVKFSAKQPGPPHGPFWPAFIIVAENRLNLFRGHATEVGSPESQPIRSSFYRFSTVEAYRRTNNAEVLFCRRQDVDVVYRPCRAI